LHKKICSSDIALCFFGSQKEFHNPKKETNTTKFNSTTTLRVWVWGVGGLGEMSIAAKIDFAAKKIQSKELGGGERKCDLTHRMCSFSKA
jgi:hypothetical protein